MSSILGRVANGVKKTFVVLYTSTLAKNSIFDPTGTSLSSTNAEDAIKEVDGKVDKGSVSVTADGVKTAAQLLNDLSALVDRSKITQSSRFVFERPSYFVFCNVTFLHKSNNSIRFGMFGPSNDGTFAGYTFIVASPSSAYTYSGSTTAINFSSDVIDSGDKFTVYY